jgi:hypothetical protein
MRRLLPFLLVLLVAVDDARASPTFPKPPETRYAARPRPGGRGIGFMASASSSGSWSWQWLLTQNPSSKFIVRPTRSPGSKRPKAIVLMPRS